MHEHFARVALLKEHPSLLQFLLQSLPRKDERDDFGVAHVHIGCLRGMKGGLTEQMDGYDSTLNSE